MWSLFHLQRSTLIRMEGKRFDPSDSSYGCDNRLTLGRVTRISNDSTEMMLRQRVGRSTGSHSRAARFICRKSDIFRLHRQTVRNDSASHISG